VGLAEGLEVGEGGWEQVLQRDLGEGFYVFYLEGLFLLVDLFDDPALPLEKCILIEYHIPPFLSIPEIPHQLLPSLNNLLTIQ
jgi:hypothetical protein